MSWLTKLLGINNEDQNYSGTERLLDTLLRQKDSRKPKLLEEYIPSQTTPPVDNSGQITNQRPENFFGSSFYPEEYFNQHSVPKKEHLAYLEDNILNDTRKAGIPDAVVATQWANESARGTSEDATLRNNPFGLGPHWEFDTVQDATKVYIKTVLSNSGLGEEDENGQLRLKAGVTADQLIDALAGKYEMHMENKGEYGNRLRDTPEWRFYLNNQGGFK